ncbi:MAG: hypothetical protein JKY52_10415 [Flavobacteriales bacterium]|nr:hypothetical protein [Flavobacteriales bacterium]
MKITRYYIAICSLLVILAACKTTQQQAAIETPEKEVTGAIPVKLVAPVKIDLSGLQLDTAAKAAVVEDSLFVSIKRTPCYGKCPVYSADIYNSGYVVYNGRRFVKKEGVHLSRLSDDNMNSVKQMIDSVKYFDFENEYDRAVTDFATTYTTVNLNGKNKTVMNRVGGPEALIQFERHIDQILEGLSWTKKAETGE